MAELEVRKQSGEAAGKVTLDPHIFDAPVNTAVMHQALVRQLANARQGTANTKTRTEVRGGGRKPYRQKGTGRARQGSIRAPHYAGGGVVFGPHTRSYEQNMPRKQRRLALRGALTVRAQENRVLVLESLEFEVPKTREFIALLDSAGASGKVLVALENHNVNVEKSARNVPGVKVILSRNLNVHDILNHDWLVTTTGAIQQLEEVVR
ncbi:MAG: 50S ribosomal protein L4 [Candidatus Dormibacteria bacterium]